MVPNSANHDASQAGSRDRTQATNKKADGTIDALNKKWFLEYKMGG